MSYEFLRRICPRELELILTGLRQYREEEARLMAEKSGKPMLGGGTVHNS